jgi:hypothetical protein
MLVKMSRWSEFDKSLAGQLDNGKDFLLKLPNTPANHTGSYRITEYRKAEEIFIDYDKNTYSESDNVLCIPLEQFLIDCDAEWTTNVAGGPRPRWPEHNGIYLFLLASKPTIGQLLAAGWEDKLLKTPAYWMIVPDAPHKKEEIIQQFSWISWLELEFLE